MAAMTASRFMASANAHPTAPASPLIRQSSPHCWCAIDIAHALASMTYPFALQYAYNGTLEGRDERIRPLVEVECADGWMAIFIRANGFEAMCEGLDAPDLIT